MDYFIETLRWSRLEIGVRINKSTVCFSERKVPALVADPTCHCRIWEIPAQANT